MRDVRSSISRVQARWRVRSIAWTVALAGATFALTFVVMLLAGNDIVVTRVSALIAAVIAVIVSTMRQRALTAVDAAQVIEASHGSLDNLIVTAAELDANPRPVRAEIREEIVKQAADRAGSIDASQAVALLQPITIALMALASAGVIQLTPESFGVQRSVSFGGTPQAKGPGIFFKVQVTPPSYTHKRVEEFANPVAITAIRGSRIQVETATGDVIRDWIATESISLALENKPGPFFLAVSVTEDRGAEVRIVTPGKDSAFVEPKGRVDVAIQSTDDLGLSALSLKFTKASGGGENVAFTEGEVPIAIDRRGEQQWNARGSIDLSALGLEDGDMVVYRAIARDTNPNGAPVQSEQYLIEIGKNAGLADAGFALPSEEKKYAISQQMVIYKTEQLIASVRKDKSLPGRSLGEGWLDQTRMIAVEQRMVRAEVVFLGGGEVEDELEEAAKSDELTEGRLQNTGRAEMVRAITAMSRAEAQLNEGRADEALVFEKQALASLERALDRRRFFLRTLPDRSRIDANRRLTGDRRDATSWDRPRASTSASALLEAQRQLMRELAANPPVDARLAARVSALDPASNELRQAAVALASAANDEARRAAIQGAMAAIASHALRALPASTAVDIASDPLSGRLASELAARPRQ